MEQLNLDPATLTLQELIKMQEEAEDEKLKIKYLTEIVRRKPILNKYIEDLVKIHTSNGDFSTARKLFEDSIKINDCNIELWEIYMYWSIENDFIKSKDEERTVNVFKEGRAKVGYHPRSWRVWKTYARFEEMRDKKNNINLIYYSALRAQIKDIDELMETYTSFIDKNFDQLKELISRDDAPDFRDEKPNLLSHFLESNNDKDAFLKIIHRLADKAREEIDKRIVYESSITQFSYNLNFDISTNEANPDPERNLAAEKENWKSYIEMEKREGDQQRTLTLFKRMLVPFYDDFSVWNDYANYLAITVKDVPKCREIFKYLRKNSLSDSKTSLVEIYLGNASFEEKQGQIKLARKIHKVLNSKICPNFIKSMSEYLKFEQRVNGTRKDMLEFLESNLETAISNKDTYSTVFLTVNICRFHFANEQALDSNNLDSNGFNEDHKFNRTFTIIEKALLDQNSIFKLADRIEIANLYLDWLKQNCSQPLYIESIEGRLTNIGKTEPVPAEMPIPVAQAVTSAVVTEPNHISQAVPQNPVAPSEPMPAQVDAGSVQYTAQSQMPATQEVYHSGDKRTKEDETDASHMEESHKRQKTEE